MTTPAANVSDTIESAQIGQSADLSSFRDFLMVDFELHNHWHNYYVPIFCIFVITCILKILGVISSCLSCWPIRVTIESIIVFLLTLLLLSKKCAQYCRQTTDTGVFAIMPTTLFACVFVVLGFVLLWLPILGDIIAALGATVVYAVALSYSSYLCCVQAVQSTREKSLWTLYY